MNNRVKLLRSVVRDEFQGRFTMREWRRGPSPADGEL